MTSALVSADDLQPMLGERLASLRMAPPSASRLIAARRIAQALGGDVILAGRAMNPIVQVLIAR
jgi:hypothetical protein